MHANKFETNIYYNIANLYTHTDGRRSVNIKLYNISTIPAMNHDHVHVILLSIRFIL